MRALLPLLQRPSRYIGIEEGAVHKDGQPLDMRCALAFPDTYDVGMSYLGQKILYGILNARPTWWAERVMAPCREAGAVLRAYNTPLATIESGTPLTQMHCVGFSVTHELCYTNILYMLDLAGIPLRAVQRGDDITQWPLIIAGGGAVLSAEPLAPFMDAMLLGEGEESLPELLELLVQARAQGWTRTAFLHEARHIPGVYVPSLFVPHTDNTLTALLPDYTTARRRIVADLDKAQYPVAQVVPIGAVHNRLALEIARGCTRGCRFCHAGMTYRPVRERGLNTLHALLEHCLAKTGFDEVSFLSLSTGDFSALRTLFDTTIQRCVREQVSVALPSLRVGSVDENILARMADIRRTGATLAPEAGSQRLRDVINKGVTEDALLGHVRALLAHGWQQVKLYFMIGLPTETQDDLDAIAELCRKVRDAGGPRGGGMPRLQVTAAISPFVPKPYTPFQWEAQISLPEMERRVYYLRDIFKTLKCCKMRWHEPSMSHLEGILSRGDRRLADVVEAAYRKGGIFASWADSFDLSPWLEALKECGLDADEYIGPRALDAPLPWDHLEAGVSRAFLLTERERAFAAQTTDDCRYHVCRHCGACDTSAGASLLARPDVPGSAYTHKLNFAKRDQDKSNWDESDETGNGATSPATVRPSLGQNNKTKATPPRITPELTVKVMEYRLWHSRENESAFLSQLELQAILERALRRADIPLTFSQGFHPLPLISFGRALPVGVESEAEWFAVTLRRPLGADALLRRLAPHLPRGMVVLRADLVGKGTRTTQAVRERFTCTHTGTAQADFVSAWERFAAQESVLHTRETKKGPRTQDIRALVAKICVDGPTIHFTADWELGYISPLNLALAVCGADEDALAHICLRKTAQLFDDGTCFPPE